MTHNDRPRGLSRVLATLDRHAFAWLLLGAGLLAASQLRFGVGALAWIAPIPFLRHARLTAGEATATRVARRLAMSERTMQRRLQAEGVSFAQLLDEGRAALAKAHLADPAMSLAEIAWLLGFADQSSFTRSFRRWTGEPPGAWRAARARSAR